MNIKSKSRFANNGRATAKPRPNLKKAATKEDWAEQLIEELGPFICLGNDWWKWNGSIWKPVSSGQYLYDALMVQPKPRVEKTAREIVSTMNMLCQKDPDLIPWRRGIGFKNEETVIINVQNGVVRIGLLTGEVELIAANPDHYATAQLPVNYLPEAQCPTFFRLLESALPDQGDRTMLQCYAGYCLLPDTRFQCVLLCHGSPNSGKSLLIYHGLGSIFGEQLMSHVSLEKLCSGGDELRHLESALVNLGTEIDSRVLKDTAVFNQMVNSENLDVALKYDRSRRIKLLCKHIFIGNHLPRWDRGSDAQARRIKILHFPSDFSGEPKDGKLERQVKLEADGIFQWALQGLFKIAGLSQMPVGSSISQAFSGEFKKQNNPVVEFNRRYVEFGKALKVSSHDYHKAFEVWIDLEDITVNSDAVKLLRQHQAEIRKSWSHLNGKACYVLYGLQLNAAGQELLKNKVPRSL